MDGDLSQPTQPATQNVIDPRRVGKQNSGFTDEDIADIICLLFPYSPNARSETARLAREGSPYVIGGDEARNVDVDYTYEDYAGNFGLSTADPGPGPALVLRLSARVKEPQKGFTFGRNPNRCDICFNNDSLRRLSNIHFRIFINEHGVLMLQDQSTNGTVVDEVLLKARRPGLSNQRTLNSGIKISILLQNDAHDLEFLVRVPRREGQYESAYQRNVRAYLEGLASLARPEDRNAAQRTIGAGPAGIVNLFPAPPTAAGAGAAGAAARPPPPRFEALPTESLSREWNGSSRYNRVGQIGKGAFATVHKVTAKFDGQPYAAKELDKRRFIKNGILDQKVENEMRIMQRINHPNIVRYIEHFDFDDRLLILIMEYVPLGDLGSLISSQGSLPEATVKEMAAQLIDALGYLHRKSITHRDVKPDNILIESLSPFTVKLTDFGLSKMVDNEQTFLRTFCGTLLYCAPEVYGEYTEYDENGIRTNRSRKKHRTPGQRYDHAVDIWSLGGVLFYCLTGRPPYPVKTGTTYMELLNWIMTRPLNVAPLQEANASAQAIHFLSLMLQNRPENRASIEALQTHPWLADPEAASADALEQRASQLSLSEDGLHQQRPNSGLDGFQSDDEILDDDMAAYESQAHDMRGRPSEFPDEGDDEEYDDMDGINHLLRQHHPAAQGGGTPRAQQPRLFGEVNVSAIGSSGVITRDRLNLPLSDLQSSTGGPPEGYSSDSEHSSTSDNLDVSEGTFLTPRARSRRQQQRQQQQGQQGQQWSQPQSQQASGAVRGGDGAGGGSGALQNGHGPAPLSQSHNFLKSHSVDELNNMTFDVASQSLGGAESILGNLNMKSLATSNFKRSITDFSTSKRKPAPDTSDEFESAPPSDKPTIKRLKSEARIGSSYAPNEAPSAVPDEADEEAKAYAAVMPVNYSKTGRQIDLPVHKSVYWTSSEPSTWHLQYPEMTQLQYNAFELAASARGEDFRPSPSLLWALALKHFPPTATAAAAATVRSESTSRSRSRSGSRISDTVAPGGGGDISTVSMSEHKENIKPQTTQQAVPNPSADAAAAPYEFYPSPDAEPAAPQLPSQQQQAPHAQIVVPVVVKQSTVAHLESAPASVVRNIHVSITEAIASWGRHPNNTLVFVPRTEQKVPKYAFKILLWRNDGDGGIGSEPWKDLQPWDRWDGAGETASRYHFYISSKARSGILVNGETIPSSEPGNTETASRHWTRLHDGDLVVVWHNRGGDPKTAAAAATAAGTKLVQTELVFRCSWGGSAKARSALPASQATVRLVDEATSQRLDEACLRAQRFVAERELQQRWIVAANNDVAERMKRIDQERLRSVEFDQKRADVLAAHGLRQHLLRQRAGRPPLPPSSASAPAASGTMLSNGGSSSTTPTPSVAAPPQRSGHRPIR